MRWLAGVALVAAGWVSAQPVPTTEAHRGRYLVKGEDFTSADGIRFFALQRMDSGTVDQAVLSIDGTLPLAHDLTMLNGWQVEIVITKMEPRTLQRLHR